jgi:hypothetical protein
MVLKKHVYLFLYALASFLSLWVAYAFMWGTRVQVQKLCISYDDYLAPKTQKIISTTLQEALNQGKGALATHAEVRQNAPHIKKLTINRYKPGQVAVKLTTERPFLLIKKLPSDHLILSEAGTYTPQSSYARSSVTGLAHIIVNDQQFTPSDQQALFTWAQKLPDDFFDHYAIEWHKNTNIVLRDKQLSRLTVIATAETTFTPKVLKKLADMRAQVEQKKGTKEWKADIRFNKQIVLSEIKKGKGTR